MVPRIERGTERWFTILDYLEAHGGRVQLRREEFAEKVGVEFRALARYLKRMEDLGAIEVIRRGSPGIGYGRPANEYVMVMSAQRWREEGPAIVDKLRRERRAATERVSRKARARAERLARELENSENAALVPSRPVARPDVADLLADPDEVGPLWDDELVDEADTDAWLL